MSNLLRVKCSCGHVSNVAPGEICPKCKQPINIPTDALLTIYRKGSPIGVASGFGIYINGEPMGHIGNKETVKIPLNYGSYNLHIASGMNRRCNDLVFNFTPENRFGYAKIWMKMGFWTNSFVIEPATAAEMPE